MVEQTEPFYHVLEIGSPLSASLDQLSLNSAANVQETSVYGGSDHEASLSQSPKMRSSDPILSSPSETGSPTDKNGWTTEGKKKDDKNNNSNETSNHSSSQTSVYYAQIIYDEYEKMKRDSPAENGSCRRVPLMINPLPSSRAKKQTSSVSSNGPTTPTNSGTYGGQNLQNSGSNTSLKVFRRCPVSGGSSSGGGGTTAFESDVNNSVCFDVATSYHSPPHSGGSSAEQAVDFSQQQQQIPSAIKTLPVNYHRHSKSHIATFAGYNTRQMPTEFGTLSSRPVLPPPPPPPVPPFSHVPSTSMITDPPNYVVDAHTHARANSFTLRERPLPQRPDVPVPTPSTLASLNKTQSSRSATPEPSRRAPSRSRTREPQSNSRQYKTLPHPKRGSKHSLGALDVNSIIDGTNHFAPNQAANAEGHRRSRFSQSKIANGGHDEKAAVITSPPQTSKISATFSTLKRLLKRDKTPSRTDPEANSDPSKAMTLSVYRHSDYNQDDEELAYDVQQLSIPSVTNTDDTKSVKSEEPQPTNGTGRDKLKPLEFSSVSINRTQSLGNILTPESGDMKNCNRGHITPRRPVRIVSFRSQASNTSEDQSSLSSSQCTTPVQYVNTLIGSSASISEEVVDYFSEKHANMLNSYLESMKLVVRSGEESEQRSLAPLLAFSCDNQITSKLCAMFLFDLLSQLNSKYYDSALVGGIGPHMLYIAKPSSEDSSGFSQPMKFNRPRLVIKWDCANAKKIMKPDPAKVSDLIATVVYVAHFRSISSSIASVVQHVKTSVLVDDFFKLLISDESIYACSPTLVQCFISCYLGWIPATLSDLFLACSTVVPTCNFNSLANHSEPLPSQVLVVVCELWMKLEKSKLANELFFKLLNQSVPGADSSAVTDSGISVSLGSFADDLFWDVLHDRVFLICTSSACNVLAAIKLWSAVKK